MKAPVVSGGTARRAAFVNDHPDPIREAALAAAADPRHIKFLFHVGQA